MIVNEKDKANIVIKVIKTKIFFYTNIFILFIYFLLIILQN